MVPYQSTDFMGRKKSIFPAYLNHAPSGQARIVWKGQTLYLGRHGSPESMAAYQRVLAEITAYGGIVDKKTTTLSVRSFLTKFYKWADSYYGKNSNEPGQYRIATADLLNLFGDAEMIDLNPGTLKLIRENWIARGRWCRSVINKYVRYIFRALAWGVEEGLIPAALWTACKSIKPLAAGRTPAVDHDRILSVDPATVAKTLPHLPPECVSLIMLQAYTACRPGEAIGIRLAELDRSGPVWKWALAEHKTARKGRQRLIAIGPKAQVYLLPYIETQQASSPPPDDDRLIKRYGTVTSYRRCIRRACLSAGLPPWHPHQLRHLRASQIVSDYSLDAARSTLGHSHPQTTMIYNDGDWSIAEKVARETG